MNLLAVAHRNDDWAMWPYLIVIGAAVFVCWFRDHEKRKFDRAYDAYLSRPAASRRRDVERATEPPDETWIDAVEADLHMKQMHPAFRKTFGELTDTADALRAELDASPTAEERRIVDDVMRRYEGPRA